MQLTGNGYQLDCNIPDSTIGYFKSKKRYHYYDKDTKEYYGNEGKNDLKNYVPCDGRSIEVEDRGDVIDNFVNKFISYPNLSDRIAKVNEELQNYCEREVNHTAFNVAKVHQIFDKITEICMKYQIPRNIILRYYLITSNQLTSNIPSINAHEIINEIYNEYAKIRE